jgi:hypothetical protein
VQGCGLCRPKAHFDLKWVSSFKGLEP